MTGLTRNEAACICAEFLGGTVHYTGGVYDTYTATAPDGRKWKFVRDSSISGERRSDGGYISDSDCQVELVSPICKYEDIETIQELLRKLRGGGAFVNGSCGVHIHVDAAPFDAPHLRNLVNIVAGKEDLLFRALRVDEIRERDFCKKIDSYFLAELNRKKPKTLDALKSIWYRGRDGSGEHYHSSRYHCLNLHSVFQKGTVEFRAFNGEMHAGKIRAYIQLCLAMTAQALNQRYATQHKTETNNDKYSFRVWLLRLGMIGDEFKTARHHLLKHLDGNTAWRDPQQAMDQKRRLKEQQWAEQMSEMTM